MIDIRQGISWAASNKHCLQSCPCLQVSLHPTRVRSLDSQEVQPRSTRPPGTRPPQMHLLSYTAQAPLHSSRPQNSRFGTSTGVWTLWSRVFRLRVCLPQGSVASVYLHQSLASLYKDSSGRNSGLFRIFFPLCGCKSRTLFVSNR